MDKTILVVDDHPLFSKAMVGLLESRDSKDHILTAGTAEIGLKMANQGDIDLILLDLGLPGVAGVDAISLFRRASKALIVVVSASEHRQEISAAMRAGASVVVSKGVPMEKFQEVIELALSGGVIEQKWMRPSGSLSLADDSVHELTTRQQEIATLLMNGLSNKEIGMRLGLAEITVKTHLTSIFRLLRVVNRTQAVVAIRRLGVELSEKDPQVSR